METGREMNRREFLKKSAVVGVGVVIGPKDLSEWLSKLVVLEGSHWQQSETVHSTKDTPLPAEIMGEELIRRVVEEGWNIRVYANFTGIQSSLMDIGRYEDQHDVGEHRYVLEVYARSFGGRFLDWPDEWRWVREMDFGVYDDKIPRTAVIVNDNEGNMVFLGLRPEKPDLLYMAMSTKTYSSGDDKEVAGQMLDMILFETNTEDFGMDYSRPWITHFTTSLGIPDLEEND